jgi:demethylmenaquinone methyltransferase/2-methoxy-6-polyprenyl-1,4-benzoquinol methylase
MQREAQIPGEPPSARKDHALSLFAGIPVEYDRAGAVLGLGQDARWRRAMVAAVDPAPSARVLDVATGTGLVARELVRRSGCSVVGVDQSEAMLARARARTARHSQVATQVATQFASRARFERAEAEHLPFEDGEFDALTFTYLLRYVDDPAAVMHELARVVRPGGRVGMVEFGRPPGRVQRAGWSAYTRLVLPPLGRLFSREWYEVGRFLGPSIADFDERYPVPRLAGLWRDAGLTGVSVRRMSLGAGLVMWGTRA